MHFKTYKQAALPNQREYSFLKIMRAFRNIKSVLLYYYEILFT
jgi:hypothetical protein